MEIGRIRASRFLGAALRRFRSDAADLGLVPPRHLGTTPPKERA